MILRDIAVACRNARTDIFEASSTATTTQNVEDVSDDELEDIEVVEEGNDEGVLEDKERVETQLKVDNVEIQNNSINVEDTPEEPKSMFNE
jgi:hypothetical protein